VSAKNLPREKAMIRVTYDMDPFGNPQDSSYFLVPGFFSCVYLSFINSPLSFFILKL